MPLRKDPLNINICRPIWSESQSGGVSENIPVSTGTPSDSIIVLSSDSRLISFLSPRRVFNPNFRLSRKGQFGLDVKELFHKMFGITL